MIDYKIDNISDFEKLSVFDILKIFNNLEEKKNELNNLITNNNLELKVLLEQLKSLEEKE